jgi:hypothetical protein
VVIRAMQDPALMRGLGTHALSYHLVALGQLLADLTADGMGPQLPSLQTFLNLTIGEDVEDAEEAYDFVRTLGSPLRERVEGGISRVLRNVSTASNPGPLNLVAIARLLAIALRDLPFVAHVLNGGEPEGFLPAPQSTAPTQPLQPATQRKSGKATPPAVPTHLQGFVGAFVEVAAVVSEAESGRTAGRLFITIGRVVEISTTYVILRSLRAQGLEGEPVLVGLAHVVAMRKLSGGA